MHNYALIHPKGLILFFQFYILWFYCVFVLHFLCLTALYFCLFFPFERRAAPTRQSNFPLALIKVFGSLDVSGHLHKYEVGAVWIL